MLLIFLMRTLFLCLLVSLLACAQPLSAGTAEARAEAVGALSGETQGQPDFYFLGIGIGAYQYWPPLKSPVADVKSLQTLLEERYLFSPEHTRLVLDANATRQGIFEGLNWICSQADDNDSVVVFFAGHGRERGFLIPWEGRDSDDALWISTDEIRRVLQRSDARHILMLSDGWFVGDFLPRTRVPADVPTAAMRRVYARPSRSVLSFDGNAPVVVGTEGTGASVFSGALLDTLRANRAAYLLPVTPVWRDRVRALTRRQQPGYVPSIHAEEMLDSGSAGGAFIFFLDPRFVETTTPPPDVEAMPPLSDQDVSWLETRTDPKRRLEARLLLTSPRGGVLQLARGRTYRVDGTTVASFAPGIHKFILRLETGDRLYGRISIGSLDDVSSAVTYGHTVGVFFKDSHVRRALQGQPVRYEVGVDPRGGSVVSYLLSLHPL